MNEKNFKGFEGADLFYREWNYAPNRKTLIILHRGHEHSGRLTEFAEDDRFSVFNVFSYDLRGHGHTKEKVSGVFMDYVRDLDAFVKYLSSNYSIDPRDIFLVANSVSSVITTAWVHDYAPKIAGMALLAPAFDIKLYIPFAKQFVDLASKWIKGLTVTSYVRSGVLTHNKEQQKAYDNDALITKSIDGRMLVDFLDHGKRIVEDAAGIDVPTIVFSAGKDYVVKNNAQKKFFINLSSYKKEFIKLPDFFHGILFEEKRTEVYDQLHLFIEECFELAPEEKSLAHDKFTKNEYFTLSLQMIPFFERINFSLQKWTMSKIGFLSNGMQVGLKYGFDSGISLDYVYENKPQGKLGIGKLIDYFYLNAIGWRGIRLRKINLIKLVEQEIFHLKSANKAVRILDIAGGVGSYLFDLKDKYPDIEIVVNDFKKENIQEGEKKIRERQVEGMRFTNYDCFNAEMYNKLDFNPNITIISGVFELFENNIQISKAIAGAVSVSEKEGVIIYTGQPWHPQLKMIAYVLNSHKKTDWVMRRRSQKELDRVFEYNGISKKTMLIDNYGIFTVSAGRILNTLRG